MPVDTQNNEVVNAAGEWRMIRDCIGGARTIKAGGTLYLPRLAEQSEPDYQAYKARAVFFGATSRTREALFGLLFRKPATVEAAKIEPLLDDIDLNYNDLDSYARKVAADVCSVGRAGTLIDFSDSEKRPYFAYYIAENIINWRCRRAEGKMVLEMLCLYEPVEEPSADPFMPKCIDQWRVLTLLPTGVQVDIWRRVTTSEPSGGGDAIIKPTGGSFQVIKSTTLTRRGEALKEIPFIFHNATEPGPCIGPAPMADIAHVNVSHYMTSADLENGRHVCGLPTPFAIGWDTKERLFLGTSYAWASDNPNAKAGFIEFTGQGLGALEKGLAEKTEQMAALGARLIEPRSKDAESFDTVSLRSGAETSSLAKIALQVSDSLTDALEWLAWWDGTAPDPDALEGVVTFSLNRDFITAEVPPDKLLALVSAWQQNAISRETLFFNLQKGEIIPDGRTIEEEVASIQANPPVPPMPPPGLALPPDKKPAAGK